MDVTVEKVRSFGGQIDALAATSLIAIFGLEPMEDVARYAASAAMAIQKVAARAHDEEPGCADGRRCDPHGTASPSAAIPGATPSMRTRSEPRSPRWRRWETTRSRAPSW